MMDSIQKRLHKFREDFRKGGRRNTSRPRQPQKKWGIAAGIITGMVIVYATNDGVRRPLNRIVAAVFAVGPEAKGCERRGAWTLCLPPGDIVVIPDLPRLTPPSTQPAALPQ